MVNTATEVPSGSLSLTGSAASGAFASSGFKILGTPSRIRVPLTGSIFYFCGVWHLFYTY